MFRSDAEAKFPRLLEVVGSIKTETGFLQITCLARPKKAASRRLAAQRRQGAAGTKRRAVEIASETCSASAIPHIHYDLANSLFCRVQETIANFIARGRVRARECAAPECRGPLSDDESRRNQLLSNEIELLPGVALRAGLPQLDSRAAGH